MQNKTQKVQTPMNVLADVQETSLEEMKLEERELVRQTVEGCEHAYAQLVTRFSPPTYRFLYRMLGNAEDAEDLTQDTFYELHRNRANLRIDTDLLPYLFTIARRKAISLLRWRKVRWVLSPLETKHEQTVASPNGVPRDQTHEQKIEELVHRAIGTLNPEKRAVLVLRFFEGLPYQDIASVMNKPEGTVKSLAFRAEQEMRKKLAIIEEDIWQR